MTPPLHLEANMYILTNHTPADPVQVNPDKLQR